MNSSNRHQSFTTLVAALAATLLSSLAQSPVMAAEEQGGLLEEIVVTAEFREANVQDTPLAVTAINAEMLEARSQTNLAQITAQAPNVSLRPAGSSFGSAMVAFIRGIGQTDFNPSVEPGVGIYVDDVYYSTITGNLLDLMDLDRVEVLRGPQGTLAGRNAIGGAIKLFTRKPDGKDDGYFGATYGSFNRTDVRGAGGFTLIPDKLYMRVAGTSENRDGYVTRYDYACVNHLPPPGQPGGLPTYKQSARCDLGTEGGTSYTSGRIQLRWVLTDNFEANIAASIVNDNSEAQPSLLVAAKDDSGSSFPILSPTLLGAFTPNPAFNPASGSFVPIFYDNNGNGVYNAGIDVPFDNRFATGGTFRNYATYINDGKSTPSPLFQGGTPGANEALYKPDVITPVNHLKAWDWSMNLDWKINDDLSLLSVTSYRRYRNDFAEDTDGSPLAVQQLLQVLNHRQWTQEFRLNANKLFDGKLDTTIGFFYLDQKTNEDARVDLPYVGFDFLHGPDIVPSTNTSFYGHAVYHASDKFDISAGLRYSMDDKSYTFHRHNPDGSAVQPCANLVPGFPNPFFWESTNPVNCGVYGLDGLTSAYSSERLDWRTALSYDVDEDLMVYFQAASGYKAGGNNARPFFPSQLFAFNPEELVSYEGGLKSTWWKQLRLNAAVFYNDYTAIQLPTNVCTWAPPLQQTPCASQNNVGDAGVWGIEVEGEWHPTDAFSLDASYSYLNFEYSKILQIAGVPASAVTLNMISPYTPENKFSIGAQYEIHLGNNLGTLTPRIDGNYQGTIYANAVNAATNRINAYWLLNGRITWRSPSDNWEVSAEATNLMDTYYYQTLFDLYTANGYIDGQPGRPIEWAISVKRRF